MEGEAPEGEPDDESRTVSGRLTLVPSIARPSPPSPSLLWPGEALGNRTEILQCRSWEDGIASQPSSRVSRTWRSNSLYPISPSQMLLGVEKVSRSSSLTTPTLKDSLPMDTLKLPDPRRLSYASDGSAVSSASASSLSDYWSTEFGERRNSPFGQVSTSEAGRFGESNRQTQDFSRRISNESEASWYTTDLLDVDRKQDFDRRSSGIGSDFEGTQSRLSFSFSDRQPSRLSVDYTYDRRSSSQSNYSDRRSSCESRDCGPTSANLITPTSSSLKTSPGCSYPCPPTLAEYLTPALSPTQHSYPPVQPGMRGVPEWLKSLRLHKYTHIVMTLSYREMLALTEQKLEKMGVTKGARRKLAASVTRLRERPHILAGLDREVEEGRADSKKILTDLEAVLRCPITTEEQVPGVTDGQAILELIMATLRRVCSSLLLSPSTDLKTMALFSALLDLCLSSDAYSTQEKQLLLSWQQKIVTIWGPLPLPTATQDLPHKQSQLWQLPPSFRRYSLQNRYSSLPWACPRPPGPDPLPLLHASHLAYQPRPQAFQQRRSVPNIKFNMARRASHDDLSLDFPLYSFPPPDIPQPNPLQRELNPRTEDLRHAQFAESWRPIQETNGSSRSADCLSGAALLCPSLSLGPVKGRQISDSELREERELDSRLESLCLSVTEHALSSDN